MRVRCFVTYLLIAASLAAGVATAGDGRIEINQVRALEGGVSPGDAPGFPVSLTESGSYVLTSDLSVSDITLTAIRIGASNVTLDLGGHVMTGPRVCTGEGSGVTCNNYLSGGNGIDFGTGTDFSAIMIRNGTIRGFNRGVDGIWIDGCIIEGLNVARNSDQGLIGDKCILIEVTAERNASDGISPGAFSLVTRSVSVGNGVHGIDMGGIGSIAIANTVRINGDDGISANNGSLVAANAVSANELGGIYASSCAVVQGNSSSLNRQQQLEMVGTVGWSDNILKTDPIIPTSTTFSGGTQMGPNVCDISLCP